MKYFILVFLTGCSASVPRPSHAITYCLWGPEIWGWQIGQVQPGCCYPTMKIDGWIIPACREFDVDLDGWITLKDYAIWQRRMR